MCLYFDVPACFYSFFLYCNLSLFADKYRIICVFEKDSNCKNNRSFIITGLTFTFIMPSFVRGLLKIACIKSIFNVSHNNFFIFSIFTLSMFKLLLFTVPMNSKIKFSIEYNFSYYRVYFITEVFSGQPTRE